MPWRLIDTPPAPGAFNMAVDRALMESVRGGHGPVLRFYRWSPACLSLGRNQPADGCYDREALRARGIDVVRRPTGGRAVLHDRELTYSVVMSDRTFGSPRTAYAAVNRALVAGLRRLGVPASLQPTPAQRSPIPSLTPCFRDPAEGEVVVGGRKLVGSAQLRESGVVLQHGSLLLEDDQSRLPDLLAGRRAAAGEPPATLADHLDPLPAWGRLVTALAEGWEQEMGVGLLRSELSPLETARAAELELGYGDTDWTWRKSDPGGWHGPRIRDARRTPDGSPSPTSRNPCDI